MKFGVVTFPGSNCDYDTLRGLIDVVGAEAEYLWHKDRDLGGVDVVVLPACEAGLLPGALLKNETLQFVSSPVTLLVENADTMFTSAYQKGELLRMPIAHGDGRYTADEKVLDTLEAEDRVVFRYVDAEGNAIAAANPNGAARNIAGIVNESGNVLGIMPHPERAMDDLLGSQGGVRMFESILSGVRA